MLDVLFTKAKGMKLMDVDRRVTQQNMIDFEYGMQFEAIFIPARSFLHLVTQDDQIACLRNIHLHLRDNGRFMLNFFTPSLKAILDNAQPNSDFRDFGKYPDPNTGDDICVSSRQVNDVSEQVQHSTWRFAVRGTIHESPMLVRWIYRNEFELLAKLAGFRVAALYSGFDKAPYNGEGEMIWVLEKETLNNRLKATR